MTSSLVTGETGFIGSALVSHLTSKGIEVVSIGNKDDRSSRDIQNRQNISKTFANKDIREIYHLAAKNTIPNSWTETESYFATNVTGTFNLLNELKSCKEPNIPFLFVSSSSVYGNGYQSVIREDFELKPVNPYGMTKACAETLCKTFFHTYKLQTKIARPFYVTGHACPRGVISEVAKSIASIEVGSADPEIKLGNTQAVLDVIDIHDCVSALEVIAQKGAPGEAYNVSTGEGHSVKEVTEILFSMAKKSIKVEQAESKMRSQDQNFLVGDPSKLKSLGWTSMYTLDRTLEDVLSYWRKTLTASD